ncbi:hypothetical protein [Litorisediminicola beolgyonensis]|uniref:Uncharacterized protein n=1 Tax=Litorisediminicola beolgyonensis TaxID=1173614 RepID=A0ABW3ZHQ5_9RHOB
MRVELLALLLLLPAIGVFIYAAIHEYRRYKSEGSATYGLVYDEETGTTHVTGIAEGEESFDPSDFDYGGQDAPEDGDEDDTVQKDPP